MVRYLSAVQRARVRVVLFVPDVLHNISTMVCAVAREYTCTGVPWYSRVAAALCRPSTGTIYHVVRTVKVHNLTIGNRYVHAPVK